MFDINDLNPMQRKAVLQTEGPVLILAGAGSGKTRALTYRIAYLLETGVSPENILAITFTNKAAREMRDRVNALALNGERVWVSTFHSACVRILRREIHNIGRDNNFTIFDADDSERLMKQCVLELNLNVKQHTPKSFMNIVSAQKNELIGPENYAAEVSGDFRLKNSVEAYRLYQAKLLEANALDFDDIIFRAVELFVRRPDVLERYQDRFHYIMVDEYQDTNAAQYKLVGLLAARLSNLCVVGDDDQSIYGWRGANVRNILDFEKDFPGAAVIKLEQNYRSTKVILDAANSVIRNNEGRTIKSLWTENRAGTPVNYRRLQTDRDEGLFVAETVCSFVEKGSKYADFAVLYRNNAQSRSIEDMLVRQNVPYRLFGGVRFYERREVKDVLAYLKVILNPRDVVSLARIINVPRRGIGDSTLGKILTYSAENGVPLYESLRDAGEIPGIGSKSANVAAFFALMEEFREFAKERSVTELIGKVLLETGYSAELVTEGTEEALGRVDNINELLSKAAEHENENPNADLAGFLEDVALVADIDNYDENEDSMVLMTLHSSKGLEFPCVFITGVEEGIFPSYRSVISASREEMEEERRLCYVGITRARERLYLTTAETRMQFGQSVRNAPSRFLGEIPDEYFEGGKNGSTVKRKYSREPDGIKKIFVYGGSDLQTETKASGVNKAQKGAEMPGPKDFTLDFNVGDTVRQAKYGIGRVVKISPAGADYEATVDFQNIGEKKILAKLSKLAKF